MKTTTTNIENRIRKHSHVSWGAIFAGFVGALSIIFLLNLLGVGIGFASINPLEERDPLEGLGWGTIIWWTASNLIALFVGGMIAGRLAGFTDKLDGALHAAIAWGLYVLLSIYLITSAVGNVFSGIAGTATSIFGGDKAKVLVNYDNSQKGSETTTNLTMDKIKEQILHVVNKGESLNILPDSATEETKEAMKNNTVTASGLINSLDVDEFVSDLNFNLDDDGNLKITTGDGEYFQKEKLKTYFIQGAEEIISPTTIQHFNFRSKELLTTNDFLPEKRPLKIILSSGASCPDALVDEVVDKLLSYFNPSKTKEEVLEGFVTD